MQIIPGIKGHHLIQAGFGLGLQGFMQRSDELSLQVHLVRRQEIVGEAVAAGREQGQHDQDGQQQGLHFCVPAGICSRALSRSALLKSSASLMGSRPGM